MKYDAVCRERPKQRNLSELETCRSKARREQPKQPPEWTQLWKVISGSTISFLSVILHLKITNKKHAGVHVERTQTHVGINPDLFTINFSHWPPLSLSHTHSFFISSSPCDSFFTVPVLSPEPFLSSPLSPCPSDLYSPSSIRLCHQSRIHTHKKNTSLPKQI